MFGFIKIPDDVKLIILSYLRKSIKEELKKELTSFTFITFKNLVRKQIHLEELLWGGYMSDETKTRIRIMSSLYSSECKKNN